MYGATQVSSMYWYYKKASCDLVCLILGPICYGATEACWHYVPARYMNFEREDDIT
ncbi:hypothetical protein AG1IA_08527 [Rhizoctonia solani AG-1 IA]|uniref:Uncharacterized protein n=1 Tax=Thanatephorus cucumeris (strain AG1-IA) TaxID=983506 RepID=L8WL24_THACA|nr:hypothetical protein AG1IA_08527 [Rhizoctonia solani AG-1 IA]